MGLRMGNKMPSIAGGTDWLNSPALSDREFEGFTTLVHFWAISCGSCKDSLPDVSAWLEKYASRGLKILSVHMPRQESDTKLEAVKEAVAEYGMKQPCVVDNWHAIADGFENKFVPAYYLFDKTGKLRHFQAGEKAAKMVEPVIVRVLAEQEDSAANLSPEAVGDQMTVE